MKVGVVVVEPVQSGGGFNQALNAVAQIGRLSDSRFEVAVYCFYEESLPLLRRLGFVAKSFRFGFTDRFAVIANLYPMIGRLLRCIVSIGKFERVLVKDGVDLVYFTSPCQYAASLMRLNYIATVWDLCHRDFPEFPEVRAKGEFERRELLYQSTLHKAALILTDSVELSLRVRQRYGIDGDRILPMPFGPAPFLDSVEGVSNEATHIDGEFFFYPAQYWPHKNHVRILEAVRWLKEQNVRVRVAFCGKDCGNLDWIREQASKLGVAEQIHFFGFVSMADINYLYSNCIAVLMPTYFGPTNIPPLEAWSKEKPLIYSNHLIGQVRDAALLVDPDSFESLARGMMAMLQSSVRSEYVSRGRNRLKEIFIERDAAEEKFKEALLNFGMRRILWGR